MKKYDERVLHREEFKYKESEQKEYSSIKDILKPRCQFNGRQKAIYNYLVEKYAEKHYKESKLTDWILERPENTKKKPNKRRHGSL